MELLIYLLIIIMFADMQARDNSMKMQLKITINHSLEWIKRALFASIIALLPIEVISGVRCLLMAISGGGLFGAYFTIRMNILQEDEPFFLSGDPTGSKIDYFFWKLSHRFGGFILVLACLVVSGLGIWWYLW